MAFRVRIAPSALADAEAAYLYMAEHSPAFASEWFNGLFPVIYDLEQFPGRYPTAPESAEVGMEIRQRLYGRGKSIYRILYTIAPEQITAAYEGSVRIFHIRHSARDRLTVEELSSLAAQE